MYLSILRRTQPDRLKQAVPDQYPTTKKELLRLIGNICYLKLVLPKGLGLNSIIKKWSDKVLAENFEWTEADQVQYQKLRSVVLRGID